MAISEQAVGTDARRAAYEAAAQAAGQGLKGKKQQKAIANFYKQNPYDVLGKTGWGVAPPTASQPPTSTAPDGTVNIQPAPPPTFNAGQPGQNSGDSILGGNPTGNPYGGTGVPSLYDDLNKRLTDGTINEYNNTANRLRERIDVATRGAGQRLGQMAQGRGIGFSSLNDNNQAQVQGQGLNAYAQGLGSLADMFEKNRLTGLGLAGENVANYQGGLDNWFNNMFGLLGQNQQLTEDKRSQDSSQQWQTGEKAADRTLEQQIREIMEQNQNWRDSINVGDNKVPEIVKNPISNPVRGRGVYGNGGFSTISGGTKRPVYSF